MKLLSRLLRKIFPNKSIAVCQCHGVRHLKSEMIRADGMWFCSDRHRERFSSWRQTW
jgi:hypothetical protein